MKHTFIATAVTALLLVVCSSCGPTNARRYTNINAAVRVDAVVPPPADPPMWTQEDLDRFAFKAPTNVPPGQIPWTPILRGDQLSAIEYCPNGRHGGEILFCASDHGLIHSMTLTFFDRGPVLFRILAGEDEVLQFEDSLGMGLGKGGYLLSVTVENRREAQRILKKLQEH